MAEINPYDSPRFPQQDPEPAGVKVARGPNGLGGWLGLVGLGVVLSPIRIGGLILFTLVPIFSNGTWEALTTPDSAAYHKLWAPLLVFETVGNLALLIASLALAVLFFRKSRYFPKAYIAVALIGLGFMVCDTWLCSLVLPNEPTFDEDTVREFVRSFISAAIWIPYMLVSKRVKNTFV